jgi:glutamyl-tRNA synthetase
MDALFKEICSENSWKMSQVGQPTRIALSGGTQAPGIGEIIEVLGVEEATRRIIRAREVVTA